MYVSFHGPGISLFPSALTCPLDGALSRLALEQNERVVHKAKRGLVDEAIPIKWFDKKASS